MRKDIPKKSKEKSSRVDQVLMFKISDILDDEKLVKKLYITVSTLNEAHQMLNEQPIEID